jgi:hypothetical protein
LRFKFTSRKTAATFNAIACASMRLATVWGNCGECERDDQAGNAIAMNSALRDFSPPLGCNDLDRAHTMIAAGEKFGTDVGESAVASLNIAKRVGIREGITAGDFLSALAAAGLHKARRDLKREFDRASVSSAVPFRKAIHAMALANIRNASIDLGAIGWHIDELRLFRLVAWRSFKQIIRESAQRRIH